MSGLILTVMNATELARYAVPKSELEHLLHSALVESIAREEEIVCARIDELEDKVLELERELNSEQALRAEIGEERDFLQERVLELEQEDVMK
jgi:hypothetical protein